MNKLAKEVTESLILVVPLDRCKDAVKEAIWYSYQVEQQIKQFAAGDLTFDDYLETVAPYIPSIDQYVEEVTESLEGIEERWQPLIV